ncbi:hypothetical protein ABZZ74_53240 [Streptomyces sp. NPDC006476]
MEQAVLHIPEKAWMPAHDSEGPEQSGARGAEITVMPGLST